MTNNVKVYGIGGNGSAAKALSVDQFFDYLQDVRAGEHKPRDLYGAVSWLFRATNLRASAMGGMPHTVMAGDEEYEDWDINLAKLLGILEADLCLRGAAYVLKRRIFEDTPMEELADLQRLNPWSVTPLTKPHPQQGLSEEVRGLYGFKQRTSGNQARWFKPSQILYFDHFYNPSDDIGPGIAPASVCGLPSELVKHMNTYASAFFERGAVIPFVLKTEGTVGEAEQKRLSNLFKRLYKGVANFFSTPLLQRGLDIERLGTAPSDLAMPDLEDSSKKQIAAAFGIPPAMLEQQDASHATATAHQLSFYTETMIPEATLIADTMNAHLFELMGLELVFNYEQLEVIQKSEAEKASAVTAMMREMRESYNSALLKRYEARFYLDTLVRQMNWAGLDDIPVEEEPELELQPEPPPEDEGKKGSAPAGGPGPPADLWLELSRWRSKAEKRGEVAEFESNVIPDWLVAQVMEAQRTVGPEDAFLFLKQAESRATIERRIERMLRKVFSEFEGTALAAVTGGGAFDYNAFRKRLIAVLGPVMQVVTTNQVLEIASEVGIAFDPAIINTQAARWAREYTYDLVSGLVNTTRDVLRDAISSFVETPDMTHKDLAKLLEPAFGKVRAEMIAVTETTRAYSEATNTYQQRLADEGLAMVKVWKTAADDRVCPICAPLDEMPEQDWPAQYEAGPPAHPRCRCGTGLTTMPLDELRKRHEERQVYLRQEVEGGWQGPEPGGGA